MVGGAMSVYIGGGIIGSLLGTLGIAGASNAVGCGCSTGRSDGDAGPESNSISCDGSKLLALLESSSDGAMELDSGVTTPDGMLMP